MTIDERMSRLETIIKALDEVALEVIASPDLHANDSCKRLLNLHSCLWTEARECVREARQMKRETIEEFLNRGGKVTRLKAVPTEERPITAQIVERPESFYELDVDPETTQLEKAYLEEAPNTLRTAR